MYWWALPSKLIFLLLRCILLKTKQYQHIRLTTFHKKVRSGNTSKRRFCYIRQQSRKAKKDKRLYYMHWNQCLQNWRNKPSNKKNAAKKFASFFFWCGLNILVRWCASKLWFIDQGHDIIKLLLYVLVLEIMIIGYGTPRVINQNWLNF